MEGRAGISATILILCSILLPLASAKINQNGLREGFYEASCPRAEEIVAEVVAKAFKKDPGIAAAFLRIIFHDCFVNGCDASLLLDATPSGEKVEKESLANGKSLRGLDIIDEAKSRLEAECPGIVSCSDLIAFATRDGSVLSGVPQFKVPGGRRDGLVSREKDVFGNIPLPSTPLPQTIDLFIKKGLTINEMVILIGAHSIGIAHCPTFAYRVNNYNKTYNVDPKLIPADVENIKNACVRPVPFEALAKTALPFDPHTPFLMDSGFYTQLLEGKGLLESDRAMVEDRRTKRVVQVMARDQRRWLKMFARALVRLGMVDVKTGDEGEIRKQCRFVNKKDDDLGDFSQSDNNVVSGSSQTSLDSSQDDDGSQTNSVSSNDFVDSGESFEPVFFRPRHAFQFMH